MYEGRSKSFRSLYFGNDQGQKLCHYINLTAIYTDALSPKLFHFAYPFKTEAFFLIPQGLINRIYDANRTS